MSKVVRLSYWDPKTAKNKYLQVNVDKFASREEAKKYLTDKRDRLKKGLSEDPPKEEKKEEEKKVELPKELPNDETNLMDVQVDITPEMSAALAKLKYSDFNLKITPKTGTSITLFGASKSFKTTLLKRILEQYYSKDCIILLCAENVHAEIYDDIPKNIIKLDHYAPALIQSMYMINKKLNNKYRFVVILDDIIDKKSDHYLEKLYLTLRNSRISIITSLQNIQLLKSTARGNSNIVIFRKFNQAKAVENYAMDEYLKNFPPFKDLKKNDKIALYMYITNKHDYFVLDVLNNSLILCQEPPENLIF
jgi:hypothetical protein